MDKHVGIVPTVRGDRWGFKGGGRGNVPSRLGNIIHVVIFCIADGAIPVRAVGVISLCDWEFADGFVYGGHEAAGFA